MLNLIRRFLLETWLYRYPAINIPGSSTISIGFITALLILFSTISGYFFKGFSGLDANVWKLAYVAIFFLTALTFLIAFAVWVYFMSLWYGNNSLNLNKTIKALDKERDDATKEHATLLEKTSASHRNLLDSLAAEREKAEKFRLEIEKMAGPYLVDWETSGYLEINAKKVYCISKTFDWLIKGDNENFIKIIDSVIQDREKKYYYLAVGEDAVSRIASLEALIKRNKVTTNIQFLKLKDSPEYKHISSNILPLVNDLVYYEETYYPNNIEKQFNTVVISTQPINMQGGKISDKMQYDIMFTVERLYGNVKNWFEDKWKSLGGEL